jgi:uncharacterized protein (UPF0335 family)
MSDDHGPGGFAAGQLRSFVERLERVNEERDELANDLRDIYAEAKANGFDTKVLRHVIKVRAQDADKRSEFETIADLYMAALGMLPGEPVEAPSRARAPARTREEPVARATVEPVGPLATGSVATFSDGQMADVTRTPLPRTPEPEPDIPAFLDRNNPECPAYRPRPTVPA